MSHQNTIVWFDLPAKDLKRATNFYSKVLNQELEIMECGGCTAAIFPHSNEVDPHPVAGCIYETKDGKTNDSDLLIYFNAEGFLKQATQSVIDNGGKVLNSVEQIGEYGYRTVFMDTEGNKVALYSKTL